MTFLKLPNTLPLPMANQVAYLDHHNFQAALREKNLATRGFPLLHRVSALSMF